MRISGNLGSMLMALLLACVTGTTAPTTAPIPRETLTEMYRRELHAELTPAASERYFEAHLQLEKYFASNSASERREIAQTLQAMNIDPNVIGRIARIRMNWPELAGGVYYINERVGPHRV